MPFTDGLPFAAGSHESWKAARHARCTRGEKTRAYLKFLRLAGALTDDEVSRQTGWPRSSVCSIRNGAMACGLVERGFTSRPSQYGLPCRTWMLTAAGVAVVKAMQESER